MSGYSEKSFKYGGPKPFVDLNNPAADFFSVAESCFQAPVNVEDTAEARKATRAEAAKKRVVVVGRPIPVQVNSGSNLQDTASNLQNTAVAGDERGVKLNNSGLVAEESLNLPERYLYNIHDELAALRMSRRSRYWMRRDLEPELNGMGTMESLRGVMVPIQANDPGLSFLVV